MKPKYFVIVARANGDLTNARERDDLDTAEKLAGDTSEQFSDNRFTVFVATVISEFRAVTETKKISYEVAR